MKRKKSIKIVSCMVALLLFLLLLSACNGKEETITFSAVIESVSENSILVRTMDFDDFDKASVDLNDAEYDFELTAGQTVEITILPEIRESYPVQVTGVKILLKEDAAKTVADYFPIQENVRYVYEGEGNEFAAYEVFADYIKEGKIQQRVDNGGSVIARVIEIKDGKLTRVFYKGEVYYRENLLQERDDSEEVLLMEPLEIGTTWTLEDGRQRTITGTSTEVETPMGTYSAIEVITEGTNDTTEDYYVKGIGLVKSVFRSDGTEVSSSLKTLEENATRVQMVPFYYPNVDEGKIYFETKEVSYRTNDSTAEILKEAYQGAISDTYGEVFSTNTVINRLTIDENSKVRLDLNGAFLSEMNAGSAYEAMILQSIANTFGQYYGAEEVILTIEGKPYESGHIKMEEGQSLPVDFEDMVEIR